MDTDWITEGARVAEYDRGHYGATARLTTVERFTATQIVLANGNRYRRDTLRRVGDHYGSELLAVDDRRVVDTLVLERLRSAFYEIGKLLRSVSVRGGVEAALATLAEIERVVTEARTAITGEN